MNDLLLRVFTAAAICFPFAADAESSGYFYSGNTLLSELRTNRVEARGYVAGLHDGFSGSLCIPLSVYSGQLADVVKAYLEANPQTRHLEASGLVIIAFTQAFPCQKHER